MSKKPDVNVGITAGVKYWLFFMLSLAVLGYSPMLSITFGAIGGFASGVIAAWLKPKDEYAPSKKEQKERQEAESKSAEPPKSVRSTRSSAASARRKAHSRSSRRFSLSFRRRR